jgi:hypothetical protein
MIERIMEVFHQDDMRLWYENRDRCEIISKKTSKEALEAQEKMEK